MLHYLNDKLLLAGVGLLLTILAAPVQAATYDTSSSVFTFQKKLADKGHAQAQFKLAMMYETGSGIAQSLASARVWYTRAAYQDYKPAKHRLTYLNIKQHGFEPEHEAWLKDLKRDAMYGNGEAIFLLGQMYADGIGVKKDLQKSIAILRKATAGNVSGAEAELTRVETEYVQQQELLAEQKRKKQEQIALQKKQQQEQLRAQQLEQQRLKRLEQQRKEQERQLIAERKRQQELQKLEKVKARLAEQAKQEAIMMTGTDNNDICSGRNQFSPTCR